MMPSAPSTPLAPTAAVTDLLVLRMVPQRRRLGREPEPPIDMFCAASAAAVSLSCSRWSFRRTGRRGSYRLVAS